MQALSRLSGGLVHRDDDSTQEFLNLLQNPFLSSLQQDAILASLGTSLGVMAVVAILFCILRPFNTIVYAPRSIHADEKHAPPPMGKGFFAWVEPVAKTKEQLIAEKAGLDAAVFLRFTRMCRNIFLTLTVLGVAIILPITIIRGKSFYANQTYASNINALMKMTPQYLWGSIFWAFVGWAWIFDIVICVFLYFNYRAIARLRRDYFNSPEYQSSLHARTLMITDIPKSYRTDEGLVKITDAIGANVPAPRTAIARNVKDLPDLIEEHEQAVKDLEQILAKYLKNPNKLPEKRPTCKPTKKDRRYAGTEKVDAIDYLTTRIRQLEVEIKEVRESVDKRNAMSYGFASFESIDDAHSAAYRARKKHPQGTAITLAPKPSDLIWKNLPLSPQARRTRGIINNLWVLLLTLVWTAPNAMIAIFLSNLSNLGKVWKPFQTELERDNNFWAVVQGVLAPALLSLFYYCLPILFRRLSIRAGDVSKTQRERHVVHKLYFFFVFNNLLVYSFFTAVWTFVVNVVKARREQKLDVWTALHEGHALETFFLALCNVSPFWISWLLQRSLGAAIDLSQIANLAWGSFQRKFMSPTPRELIQLSAPPPFDYASYYNFFLFYSTVALCFAAYQPVVLPVMAFYFSIDSWLKKYLLLYVFTTKNESGGQFWRILFNRMLFAAFFANCATAMMVAARGDPYIHMLIAMAPLPVFLLAFKWYCKRTFDDQMVYYTKGEKRGKEDGLPENKRERRGDRVGVRFGHPALYKPLMTPMVHAKSQHLLNQVYRGRINTDTDAGMTGFSDTYSMNHMSKNHPGKAVESASPFEIVREDQMDFEHYKNRPEFRDEFGGDGEMYGVASDFVRPGTPSSIRSDRPGHRSSSRESNRTGTPDRELAGTTYPVGYHQTPTTPYGFPQASMSGDLSMQGNAKYTDQYDSHLLKNAAPMSSRPSSRASSRPDSRSGPSNQPTPYDNTSYDYFRTGRRG